MLFGPTHLARYEEIFSPMSCTTHVDPDGTCRIYYGSLDLVEVISSFRMFGKTTEIRNVEFYYHMQPDNPSNRCAYPWLPDMARFRRTCPIWHFVDAPKNTRKPSCKIIITYHGEGELPYDYDAMLNILLELMESLTLSGFENVAVKIVPGCGGDGRKCRLPSEMSMALLRHHLENYMGIAKVVYAGEESRLEFRPRRLAQAWSKQPRGGEATRVALRTSLRRHQRRAKRGLRNLLKLRS